MSVPVIQIGQCGNQVGRRFYEIMYDEGAKASEGHQALLESFFSFDDPQNIRAKAFSIDMEPKVVQKNLKKKDSWGYDKKYSLVQQEGSGNNWAYGCHVHGPNNRKKMQQLFRKFAEKEDYIQCFTQIQSMAGGTGSGLGTYTARLLSEIFPKTPKYVVSVMPHLSGEVILQCYNASLSLATVYQEVDGVFIIQNDEISEICSKVLNQPKTSLEDINEIIGRNLASVFFPVIGKEMDKVYSIEQNGFSYARDLNQNLFYDPRYKLCSIRTVPHGPKNYEAFNSDTWQSLENDLNYRKKTKSLAEMMIVRGPDHPPSVNRSCPALFDRHKFYNYAKSMTMLSNGQEFHEPMERILSRAYNMLKENAYIYQYQKYGLGRDQFLDSFAQVENIQTHYSKL